MEILDWERILSYLFTGGLFAGLWEVARTRMESKGRVTEKETTDRTELSTLLMQKMDRSDVALEQALSITISDLRAEMNQKALKISELQGQSVEAEKKIVRLEIENDFLKSQSGKLQDELVKSQSSQNVVSVEGASLDIKTTPRNEDQ